eukprot:sb/3472865/
MYFCTLLNARESVKYVFSVLITHTRVPLNEVPGPDRYNFVLDYSSPAGRVNCSHNLARHLREDYHHVEFFLTFFSRDISASFWRHSHLVRSPHTRCLCHQRLLSVTEGYVVALCETTKLPMPLVCPQCLLGPALLVWSLSADGPLCRRVGREDRRQGGW